MAAKFLVKKITQQIKTIDDFILKNSISLSFDEKWQPTESEVDLFTMDTYLPSIPPPLKPMPPHLLSGASSVPQEKPATTPSQQPPTKTTVVNTNPVMKKETSVPSKAVSNSIQSSQSQPKKATAPVNLPPNNPPPSNPPPNNPPPSNPPPTLPTSSKDQTSISNQPNNQNMPIVEDDYGDKRFASKFGK
jgi:hypothetical protein